MEALLSHDPSVGAKVIGPIWAMAATTSIFLCLRLYCRISRTTQVWADDWLLALSFLFTVLSASLFTACIRMGYLTTTLGSLTITPLNLLADNTHKLALGLSKTSFAVTLLHLHLGRSWTKIVIISLVTVTDVTLLVHCILVWRRTCGSPASPFTWNPCWQADGGVWMNMAGAVVSAICDFALALIPIPMLLKLNMARREKIGVAIAMSVGLFAGIVSILKAVQSYELAKFGMRPGFADYLASLSVWIHAEPNATIIAASIPVLRVLFRDAHRTQRQQRQQNREHHDLSEGQYVNSGGSFSKQNNDKKHGFLNRSGGGGGGYIRFGNGSGGASNSGSRRARAADRLSGTMVSSASRHDGDYHKADFDKHARDDGLGTSLEDNNSEKGILKDDVKLGEEDGLGHGLPAGKIMQTREVVVERRPRVESVDGAIEQQQRYNVGRALSPEDTYELQDRRGRR